MPGTLAQSGARRTRSSTGNRRDVQNCLTAPLGPARATLLHVLVQAGQLGVPFRLPVEGAPVPTRQVTDRSRLHDSATGER